MKYLKISHGIIKDGTFKRQTLFPFTILAFDLVSFELFLSSVANVDALISVIEEIYDGVGSSSWKWNTPELKCSTEDSIIVAR